VTSSSGFEELAADMMSAADILHKDVSQVVAKGALNIKQQIKKDFRASRHFGTYDPAGVVSNVRYNRKVLANSIEAEIAPFVDQEGFGSLVGIAIHGGSRGGGGTVADPIVALQAEGIKFTEALLNLAGAVLDE
jgi:hypothetical protein